MNRSCRTLSILSLALFCNSQVEQCFATETSVADARSILLNARKAVESLTDDDPRTPNVKVKSQLLRSIADAQTAAHAPQDALVTLEECPDCDLKDSLFASMAGEFAEVGQIERARRVISQIQDHQQTMHAYNLLAKSQIRHGDIQGAKQSLSRISDQQLLHPDTLVALATEQARMGDWPGAVQTIESVMNILGLSESAWECLFQAAFSNSQPGPIRNEIARLTNESTQAYAKTGLVRILISQNDLAGAVETARTIPPGYPRASAFQSLASSSHRLGNKHDAVAFIEEAIVAAQAIKTDHAKAVTLWGLSALQAEMGALANAINTAKLIEVRHFFKEAMQSIAAVQAKAGDLKGTLRTLALLDKDSRTQALCNTAYRLSLAGRAAETLVLVQQDEDPNASSCTFSIADAQLEIGDIKGGQATLAPFRNSAQQARRESEINRLKSLLNDLPGDEGIRRQLDTIGEIARRLRSFELKLAQAQAKAGRLSDALTAVDKMAAQDGTYSHITRHMFASLIGSAMAESNQTDKALAWAKTIPDTEERVHALIGIVEGLTRRQESTNSHSICYGT